MLVFIMCRVALVYSQRLQEEKATNTWANLSKNEKKEKVHQLVLTHGAEYTLKYLSSLYSDSVVFNPEAHILAHEIGAVLFREKKLSGFVDCGMEIAYGCLHGFFEEAYTSHTFTVSELEEICKKIEEGNGFENCLHGVGHGVATLTHWLDINKALRLCDSFSRDQIHCYDGVFMEFQFSASEDFYDRDRPLYPCDEIGEKYRKACARSQPFVMQQRFGMSYSEISGLCWNSKDPIISYECIDALGMEVGEVSGGNEEYIFSKCKEVIYEDAISTCIISAASELVYQGYTKEERSALQICKQLPEAYKVKCEERIEKTGVSM